MKKIYTLFIVLFGSILFGQEYRPMLLADNYWQVSEYMHVEFGNTEFQDYQYLLTDETINFNGRDYIGLKFRKRIRINDIPQSDWSNWESAGFYLNENVEERKIYIYYDESFNWHEPGEFLLYDFSLEIGNSMNFDGFIEGQFFEPLEVIDITNEIINGESYKVFHFDDDASEYPFKIIEGICSTFGLNTLSFSWDGGWQLTDFGQNLSTKEATLSKIKIYPNPFAEKIQIENSEEIQELQLFDSQGKLISTNKNVDDLNSKLGSLNNAIYFLKINYKNNKSETIKLIKNK